MSDPQYYHEYDLEFIESFDKDAIEVQEVESSQDDRSVSARDAEVFVVTDTEYTGYYVDVSLEEGAFRQEDRPEKLLQGMRAAIRLGVTIPTPIIGDDWWVLKEFEGEHPGRSRFQEITNFKENMDIETFMWDTAKLLVLGYKDASEHNLLFKGNGEYRNLDLQSMNQNVKGRVLHFSYSLGRRFKALNLPPESFIGAEKRAVALSYYLDESGVLDEYMTEEIRENIDVIPEMYPTHSNTSFGKEDLPVVDDRVIPPADQAERVFELMGD